MGDIAPPPKPLEKWKEALDAIEYDPTVVEITKLGIAGVIEQRPPETVYNVGSGRPTAVADIVAAVERLVGRKAPSPLPPGAHST